MDKMERRKVQLDNQPVDFTSFLADLENLSGLQAQQKGCACAGAEPAAAA